MVRLPAKAPILLEAGPCVLQSIPHPSSHRCSGCVCGSAQGYATSRSHQRMCAQLKFLLDKGARVDAKDCYGQTALHWIVGVNPMLLLAKILLQSGANVNMQTCSGTTALKNCVAAGEVCCKSAAKCNCSSHVGNCLRAPVNSLLRGSWQLCA